MNQTSLERLGIDERRPGGKNIENTSCGHLTAAPSTYL